MNSMTLTGDCGAIRTALSPKLQVALPKINKHILTTDKENKEVFS